MSGFVYGISNGPDVVRIGFSANPHRRLVKLRCDNPNICELLGVKIGDRSYENYIHQRLSASRLRGDWFKRTVEVNDFIDTLQPFGEKSNMSNKRPKSGGKSHPIWAYREKHGLTLEAFGKLVGAKKGTVSRWENGIAPSLISARLIEQQTAGTENAITRQQLRPDVWVACGSPAVLNAVGAR